MEGCGYLNLGGGHVRSASRGGVPHGSTWIGKVVLMSGRITRIAIALVVAIAVLVVVFLIYALGVGSGSGQS